MTIAERCSREDDPFKAASECAVFKKELSDFRVVFYFEDRSYLAFRVAYAVADMGEDWR